jgi:hypothetical protein
MKLTGEPTYTHQTPVATVSLIPHDFDRVPQRQNKQWKVFTQKRADDLPLNAKHLFGICQPSSHISWVICERAIILALPDIET